MLPAIDISRYQGAWTDRGEAIDMIKMSGGDDGLYMDSDAATNYTDAKAHGKGVGGYHFIGWTLGAVAEAAYFLQAMSPVAENDVFALDIEAIKCADPVGYVRDMMDTIHAKINVWPLLYMNVSTLKAYDWSALLKDCGLWLADWNNDPAGTIPGVPTYVMQQYSDGPNYDHDEWFGTLAQFNAYGYHAPQAPVSVPTPEPVVVTTPVVEPVVITPVAPTATITTITPPAPTIQTTIKTNTPPVTTQDSGTQASTLEITPPETLSQQSLSTSWWTKLWNAIVRFFVG